MQTVSTLVIICVFVFIVLSVIGAIFRFAKGLTSALFSFAALAALVLAGIWLLNGEKFPF